MIKHAWSLVFFTVLGQMGAGLYLVHKLLILVGGTGSMDIQANSKRLLLISFIISILALGISFSHLGSPKNAIYALSNLRSSWLSREVFFLSAFAVVMLFEILFTRWTGHSNIREIFVGIIGTGISLAFLYTMVRLYQLETVPTWSSSYTLFHFFNTACLGGLLILLLFNTLKSSQFHLYLIPAMVILQLVIFLSYNTFSNTINYLPLLFYGLVILLLLVQFTRIVPEQGNLYLKVLATLCFVTGLLLERYLFYASYKSIGI